MSTAPAAKQGIVFSAKIAVMTAVMATVGAFFSVQAGSCLNDAAIKKTAAATHGPNIRPKVVSSIWPS
jgi:hypothetical protein